MANVVSQEVDVTLYIDGEQFFVVEMNTDFSRYSETDYVEATVVDPQLESDPDNLDPVMLEINGERVFTGRVQTVKTENQRGRVDVNNELVYQVKVFNDLVRTKTENVTLSITNSTPLSSVVGEVCEQAGVEYEINLEWYTEQRDSANGRLAAIDYPISIEETDTPASKVLDKLAKWSNADWWFDVNNVLQFGIPDSKIRRLQYVKKDSNFGQIEPPYRGVKVTGDSVVSQYGRSISHIPGYEPATAERAIVFNEATQTWRIVKGETNAPVFTYKDKGIKQTKTAELVADNFARELLRQVKGGKVTIVGRQDISERDVIELPDQIGGDYYYVGKVNHKMGSSGYETVITCEGAVPESNVLVDKDLEDNESVYFDPEAESEGDTDG